MSDYQTDDQLELIEAAHKDVLMLTYEQVGWLISEVHRYRDEQNPNQAAIYYRRIQAQRSMIENQASTIERQDATIKHVKLAVHGAAIAGAKTVNAGLLRDILSGQA